MSESRLKLIMELFEGVDSIEDLSRKLESPAERELIKRASILRYFDETVFNQYLLENVPHDDSTNFNSFISNLNVEPVPRTLNVYRIKDDARLPYIEDLLSERNSGGEPWQNKKELFQKLLDYYEEKGTEFDLDRLSLLIVLDAQKAMDEFERLYAEADRRFDLTRCDELLRTFEVRSQLLTDELRAFCQRNRQYYNARSFYAADFYQTTAYLERANMWETFKRMLTTEPSAQSEKWIFHIYATGGMGKTMFVRWLISRYCVPEPRRIPVARLDFDQLDLNSLSHYPLLLLLPVAKQLDQQIERKPFEEIYSHLWKFESLLESPTGGASDAKRFDLESNFIKEIEPTWRPTAMEEFCRTLSEANFGRQIVIVIDTFEEMLLLDKDGLVKVIKQIEEIRAAYPQLRLVLSGRYDLGGELRDLQSLFDNETIPYELERFTTSEARTYLVEQRGVKEEPFVEAIVEKCADQEEHTVNPFVLSLMADLVTSKDIESVEEIKKYPRAEVAYMIQRIISRIKDFDVRWMLRYAVIPRTLTLDVLENVMWAHLLEEREKERGKDSRIISIDNEEFDQREFWPSGPASTAEEAWKKLQPFVSTYGWVSFMDGNDASRLRLHSDVVVPMRFLLSREDIFPLLHKDAAQHFEKKAEAQSEQWAVWMSEAIYHRFQLEGPKAASFWNKQLDRGRAQTDMEMRRRIASEITKRHDYVDEKGRPLRWPNEEAVETIIMVENLCEAHHEAAIASIMLAARNEQKTQEYASEWSQAREHLLKLDALMKAHNPSFTPQFDVDTYTKLASELSKTLIDYGAVIPLMEQAALASKGVYLPLSLKFQLAEMYASLGSEMAETYYIQARDASQFLKIAFLSPLSIRLKLAQWYQAKKRFKKALDEYETALARTEVEKGSANERDIKYQMAKLNLEIGRYAAAESLSRELYKSSESTSSSTDPLLKLDFDHALLFSQIHALYLYRPLTALNNSDALLQLTNDAGRRADLLELRGYALGQLMEFRDGLTVLEQAKAERDKTGDQVGLDRTRMRHIELQLDEIGNLSAAISLVGEWEAFSKKKDSSLTCQMELLRVRCLYLQDQRREAREKWQSLYNEEGGILSLRSLVRVLSTGLALGLGSEWKVLDELVEALRKIDPPSARLPLLTAFRFANRIGVDKAEQTQSEYNRLLKLIEWPIEKREMVFHALTFADVLWFCGSNKRAKSILEGALDRSLKKNNSFAYNQALSAYNRLGATPPPDATIYNSTFLEDYKQYRSLCHVALLEQAERDLERGNLLQCEETLRSALENYSAQDITTKWTAFSEELAGRLAQRRGEDTQAESHLTVAHSIYERLGDKYSAGLIRRRSPEARKLKAKSYARPEGIYTIRLDDTADTIDVTSDLTRGDRVSHLKHSIPRDDFSKQLTATLRDRSEIFNLTKLIADDFLQFRLGLRTILIQEEELKAINSLKRRLNRPLDVRLELPSTMAKLPWELALLDEKASLPTHFRYIYRSQPTPVDVGQSEIIRRIQLAANLLSGLNLKVNGLFSPLVEGFLKEWGIPVEGLTFDAIYNSLIERLREEKGSGRVKALIISPSFETQIATQRGSDTSGFSLRYLYDELFFNFKTIEVYRPEGLVEELTAAIASFEPQLIHIESSFMTSLSEGQVHLSFNVQRSFYESEMFSSSEESDGGYARLPLTLLNDTLFKLSDASLRPVVIIEAQRPPGISATIQQMFMRNTFASELFRLGNTSAIVATGLFSEPGYRLDILRKLLGRLSVGEALGDAVNRTILIDPTVSAEVELIQSPILFTNNPSFTLLPIG